jgi:hypothetical protein
LNFHTVSGRDINKRIAETDYKIFNTWAKVNWIKWEDTSEVCKIINWLHEDSSNLDLIVFIKLSMLK